RCFGVLKRRFPVLSKGITTSLINTQAIIVACVIIHNICIDLHDGLPNDILLEGYDIENITVIIFQI
ncbi:putative nuclease HARBI1, partial [Aphis craccivora]